MSQENSVDKVNYY